MKIPMRRQRQSYERELLLEIGMALFAAGLAAGFGALFLGRATGQVRRSARRSEAPPGRGSVPAERHQNVQTVAAR